MKGHDMSKIKKAYQDIVSLLEANADKVVSEVLDQVIALASAKTSRSEGASALRNTDGDVVAIHDYYFKRFMPLVGEHAVEFGTKASTATGLNTMCKEGVSAWTKQQSAAKKAKSELLDKVSSGEIAPTDIAQAQAEIEANRTTIIETDLGFETKDELLNYLSDEGIELAA